MSTATQPGSSPPSTRKRWDAGIRAGVISAVIGFLALVVAVFAWLWPQQPGGTPAATGGGPGTGPGTVTTPGAATEPVESAESVAGPPAATYLDSAGFPPEAGGSDVVEVPRLIRGRAGYSSHPVAIRCPTNQTGDQTSEVTYLLRGRTAPALKIAMTATNQSSDRSVTTATTSSGRTSLVSRARATWLARRLRSS